MAVSCLDQDAKTSNLPVLRWLALAVLLLVEIFVLTFRYDTWSLSLEDSLWAKLLGESPLALRLGITALFATLLLGGGRLVRDLRGLGASLAWQPRQGLFLLGHLLSYAGFFVLTDRILEHQALSTPQAPLWAAGWMAAGALTVASWGCLVVPPVVGWPLLRQNWRLLAAGLAVGAFTWGAGLLTDVFWQPLAEGTFRLVRALLGLFYRDLVWDPEELIVGTSTFRLKIAPACSGYEGIGLVWAFLGVYLWLFRARLRFPQALLLLPLGTLIIWLLNAVRIAVLILIGSWGSRELALGGFHSQAGWLAFNGVALGLAVLTQRVPYFRREGATTGGGLGPAAPYLLPFLTLVATAMVASGLSRDPELLYPLRVLAVAGVLTVFWRTYAVGRWSWSWSPIGVGLLVFGLWLALEPGRKGEPESTLSTSLSALPPWLVVLWLIFRVVGSAVTVPLAEELAFRGYLLRRLQAADFLDVPADRFTWMSFLVSSALFGVMHPGRWLAGTLAGMLYALAVYRRGQLLDAALAHGTTNALLAAYVLATGSWSLWS